MKFLSVAFKLPEKNGILGIMKRFLPIMFMSLMLLWVMPMHAQQSEDFKIVREALNSDFSNTKWASYLKTAKGPLQKTAAYTFLGYKSFIASQDSRRCVYESTCSEHCIKAMKQHGLLLGMVEGIEQYARCSSFDARFYLISPSNGRQKDPVSE